MLVFNYLSTVCLHSTQGDLEDGRSVILKEREREGEVDQVMLNRKQEYKQMGRENVQGTENIRPVFLLHY